MAKKDDTDDIGGEVGDDICWGRLRLLQLVQLPQQGTGNRQAPAPAEWAAAYITMRSQPADGRALWQRNRNRGTSAAASHQA